MPLPLCPPTLRYDFVEGGTVDQSVTEEIVVKGINKDGNGGAPKGHESRSLVFDGNGNLYVSVGSMGNVDDSPQRSRIRRFDMSSGIPAGGFEFSNGEVFADGLRNTVGMAFDKHGVLWGSETGADNLIHPGLGGDIHNDVRHPFILAFNALVACRLWNRHSTDDTPVAPLSSEPRGRDSPVSGKRQRKVLRLPVLLH